MRSTTLILGLATLGVVACNTIFGIEEGNLIATDGDGGGGGGDEGGPSVNRCPAGCLPEAPTGWTGPVALTTGDSCADPDPVESLVAHRGPTALPVVCSACPTSVATEACTINATTYSDSDCQTPTSTFSIDISSTNMPCLQSANYGKSFRFSQSQYAKGTCTTPPAQKPIKPPVTWSETARGCAPTALAACPSASTCVGSLGSLGQACVYANGQQTCPADYPIATASAYRGVDDQRTCPECAPTYSGFCDQSIGGGYVSPTCDGAAGGYYNSVNCAYADATGSPVRAGVLLNLDLPYNGQCFAQTPTPTGNLVPNGAVTICCL